MPQLLPFVAGPGLIVSADYHDGKVFTKDFWMENRVGAMAGASIFDYASAVAGIPGGSIPQHTRVVGPDLPDAGWIAVMTTTGDCGWVDGSEYAFDPEQSDLANFNAWVAAGCPSKNAKGEWGAHGYPMSYIRWTWQNPSTRGPSPLRPDKHGRHKGKPTRK